MKVAIVHDWLNTKVGGAENVLFELADMYPEAPIYTLLFDRQLYDGLLDPKRVRTSRLQRLPKWLRRRARYLLPLAPGAIEALDLSGYDVVISASSAFAKSVITSRKTFHICYCYSPMRYAWDYWPRYLDEQGFGPLRRLIASYVISRIRVWDYETSSRVDQWVAISKTVQARIGKYYHQPSSIIYPPVITATPNVQVKKQSYDVVLGVMAPYKKLDLAIGAANLSKRRLVVIGDGADRTRLENLAGPTVEFVGRVSEEHKRELLAGARCLIFPQEEDFGIVPVEAMACGTPIVAYARGGATETVVDGQTGVLFHEQTAKAIVVALERCDSIKFSTQALQAQAAKFDREHFIKQFKQTVEQGYATHQLQNR